MVSLLGYFLERDHCRRILEAILTGHYRFDQEDPVRFNKFVNETFLKAKGDFLKSARERSANFIELTVHLCHQGKEHWNPALADMFVAILSLLEKAQIDDFLYVGVDQEDDEFSYSSRIDELTELLDEPTSSLDALLEKAGMLLTLLYYKC